MNRRWLIPVVAVVVLVAAVIGGAYLLTRDDDTDPAATPTTTPSTSPSETDGADLVRRAVPVYYVGDGAREPRLFREFHSEEVCPDDTCLVEAAATAALAGQPQDPDYRTPWPSGAGLNEATWNGDVLTLDLTGDLHDRPADMDEASAELAVEQLLHSALAGLGEGQVPVQLLLEGDHTDTVLGVPSSEPLAAAKPDDVQALVQVDSPAQGAEVSGTFTVEGRAAAFEANVAWELEQDGQVVEEGFTTAAECCTLAPFSFEVTASPGDYTLVVHDTDESGEGLPENKDTKEITVR